MKTLNKTCFRKCQSSARLLFKCKCRIRIFVLLSLPELNLNKNWNVVTHTPLWQNEVIYLSLCRQSIVVFPIYFKYFNKGNFTTIYNSTTHWPRNQKRQMRHRTLTPAFSIRDIQSSLEGHFARQWRKGWKWTFAVARSRPRPKSAQKRSEKQEREKQWVTHWHYFILDISQRDNAHCRSNWQKCCCCREKLHYLALRVFTKPVAALKC